MKKSATIVQVQRRTAVQMLVVSSLLKLMNNRFRQS
jgi:hypothetical protein